MKQKGIAHILILILLAIAGIGVVVFFWIQKTPVDQQDQATTPLPTTITTPTNTPTEALDQRITNKAVYKSSEHNISFSYPAELQPLELENGVISFLPETAYEECIQEQQQESSTSQACFSAVFNFTGFNPNSPVSYDEYTNEYGEAVKESEFTDDKGRNWRTALVYGQVYDYDAFTNLGGSTTRVSFQYGLDSSITEEGIESFFNEILSSLEFAANQ